MSRPAVPVDYINGAPLHDQPGPDGAFRLYFLGALERVLQWDGLVLVKQPGTNLVGVTSAR
jgi:hypothetical protein